MSKKTASSALTLQEYRGTRLFLVLFYTISFSYDLFYYQLLPEFIPSQEVGIPGGGLGYWIYAVQLGLLPVAIYLIHKKKVHSVKYIYFIVYMSVTVVNEILIYSTMDRGYAGGNVVEVFMILFSPIFVNKRFFRFISIGTIVKYAVVGLLLHHIGALYPIVLIALISAIAYILLNRFQGYLSAVEQSYDARLEGIVRGVIEVLELKDPYTRGHSERVADYSTILAEKMGLFTSGELKLYRYACLLHDVGKIHIPDRLLTKPDALSQQEYEVIKTHAAVGAEAIKGIEGLQDCVSVVRHHHERWDGTGYPDRLQGIRIPILARVTAVADAFDAMTTLRSYRPAMTVYQAYDQIVQGKGTQFDPRIVEVLEEVFPAWVELVNDHQVKIEDSSKMVAYIPNISAVSTIGR